MLIQAQQTRFAFPEASVWKAAQDRWTDVIKKTPTTIQKANNGRLWMADALSVSKGGAFFFFFLTCALKVKNQLWYWKVNKTNRYCLDEIIYRLKVEWSLYLVRYISAAFLSEKWEETEVGLRGVLMQYTISTVNIVENNNNKVIRTKWAC